MEDVDLQYHIIYRDLTSRCTHSCCTSDRQTGATQSFNVQSIGLVDLHCYSTSILYNIEVYGMLPCVFLPCVRISDRYDKLFDVNIDSEISLGRSYLMHGVPSLERGHVEEQIHRFWFVVVHL